MPRNNKPSSRSQVSKDWQTQRDHRTRGDRDHTNGSDGTKPPHRRQVRKGTARGNRRLSVRSELRREPDVRRIARAAIELAMAQAEADAAATNAAPTPAVPSPVPSSTSPSSSATNLNRQESS